MSNLKLEVISNRLNKMAILFDLKKRLDFFFSKNPNDEITLSFSFNKNCDKINKNIKFSTYSEKEKREVCDDAFTFLHKCISLFEQHKSPFGLFSYFIMNRDSNVEIKINQSNFHSIFEYADDFENKEEWIKNCFGKSDNFTSESEFKDYPKIIFDEDTFQMWNNIKNSENYIKLSDVFYNFSLNVKKIKGCIKNLTENQFILLDKSLLFIYEGDFIFDVIELDDFKHFTARFNRSDDSLYDLFRSNSEWLMLKYKINERLFKEIVENS